MVASSRDLINCLPDALLGHILSFLSTKEAASTSLLSKRWRYLLAYVPNLEFDDSVYLHPERKIYIGDIPLKLSTGFSDFVDRILALQGECPLHKFFLKTVNVEHDPVDPDCVTRWIHTALLRGVSDFHLDLFLDWDSSLPSRIFLCQTLVKLRIRTVVKPSIHAENVHLPKLKVLHLGSVDIEEKDIGFNKLLSGCPVLEELILETIWSCFWDSFSVSVATLKTLIFCTLHRKIDDVYTKTVSFDTPNLVYLEYTEFIADQYPIVKFDSLVQAKINLSTPEKQVTGNATDFVKGISNVQMLHLTANTMEVLTTCCKAIPIFNKLTHLTIESKPQVGWESLPGLLKNCPNLETLALLGLCHKATDRCGDMCLCNRMEKDADVLSCLSSSRVKVLEILMNYDNVEKQIEQVKHFLETMPHLEQLVLHYASFFDEIVEVSSQLQMLRVASPKCKVQLRPSTVRWLLL